MTRLIESHYFFEYDIHKLENKLSIKEQYCIGCSICTKLDPGNFELIDGKAKVAKQVPREKTNEQIDKAIEKCPTKAIYWGKSDLTKNNQINEGN